MTRAGHVPGQVVVVVAAASALLLAAVITYETARGPAAVGPAGPTTDVSADAVAQEPAHEPAQAPAPDPTPARTGSAGAADRGALDGEAVADPDPVPAVPALPVCSYDDLPTRFAELDDWPVTLLDTALTLSLDYYPADLVPVGTAGVEGWGEIRAFVVEDLRAMDEAAREAGAGFAVQSAFRDHSTQAGIFQGWVTTIGEAGALAESARPGHSEHQLGTALDLRSAGTRTAAWEHPDWGQTPAGAWLRENSWQYGFVISYPDGQSAATCYDYESWHFRYVGRETAEQIRTSGLTLREHLWRTSEALP